MKTASRLVNGTAHASTSRVPRRETIMPERGIVTRAPRPNVRRSIPKTASSNPKRCFTKGTSEAQTAMMKPARKNESRVAWCEGGMSRRKTASDMGAPNGKELGVVRLYRPPISE